VQTTSTDDTVQLPTPQILRTPSGEEMVVLPRQEYEALLDALAELQEDAADLSAYDAAKAHLATSGVPPFPMDLNALLRRRKRVAAIREWRGLTVAELSARAGLSPERIMEMEAGTPMQTLEEAAILAAAFNVHIGWVEP
jgi:DNA-binding XRE family transcriptional regulator